MSNVTHEPDHTKELERFSLPDAATAAWKVDTPVLRS